MANADGSLSVIQAAFQAYHGLQCGFCTPGMVMTAAALLAENPRPTEAEIRGYLDGNICRCTGYHNIVKAILAAAAELGATRVAAEVTRRRVQDDRRTPTQGGRCPRITASAPARSGARTCVS